MTETEKGVILSLICHYGADAVRTEVEKTIDTVRRITTMGRTGLTPDQQRAVEAARRPANIVPLR